MTRQNERLNQMREEFEDRVIQLLSELPVEMQMEIILRIDEQIADSLGEDRANQVIAKLLNKLKL